VSCIETQVAVVLYCRLAACNLNLRPARQVIRLLERDYRIRMALSIALSSEECRRLVGGSNGKSRLLFR
jgi:hypothetical protein